MVCVSTSQSTSEADVGGVLAEAGGAGNLMKGSDGYVSVMPEIK